MFINIGEIIYDMEFKINLGDCFFKDYIMFIFYVKYKKVSLWIKWIIWDFKNDIIYKRVC